MKIRIAKILAIFCSLILVPQIAFASQITFHDSTGLTTFTGSTDDFQEFASSSDGVNVIGQLHAIYISHDSGASWSRVTSLPASNMYGVWSSSDGTKLAATEYNGKLWISLDSGATWTARDSNRKWTTIAGSDDGTKFVAGVDGGLIYISVDSGSTWTSKSLDTESASLSKSWRSVTSDATGTKMFAISGTVYRSTDGGTSWINTHMDFGSCCYRAAASSDGTKLFLGANGNGFYLSTDSGVTYTRKTEITSATRDAPNVWGYGVGMSRDGKYLVALSLGDYVWTSFDYGITWEAQSALGQNQWSGLAAVSNTGGMVFGSTNFSWWPVNPRTVYSSSSGGGSSSGSTNNNDEAKQKEAERVRQEKIHQARIALMNKIKNGGKIESNDVIECDLPSVSPQSIAGMNTELLGLAPNQKSEFPVITKMIKKYSLIEEITSSNIGNATARELKQYGVISSEIKQASHSLWLLKQSNLEAHDSKEKIDDYFNKLSVEDQARMAKLEAVKARIAARNR